VASPQKAFQSDRLDPPRRDKRGYRARWNFLGRHSTAKPGIGLPAVACVTMLLGMFLVSEADTTAIRAAFDQGGELSAAIELRRLFPGITDNAEARACARTIAGWKPLPAAACQITPLRLRRSRARPTKP
jgi:hypothetical protein